MSKLRQLRKAAGLSQKELADKLFVNQTAVSQWERGVTTPNATTLLQLSDMFNVSADEILGRTQKKEPTTLTSDGLNDAEKEILMLFRDLPPEKQKLALRMIEAALSAEK